MFNFGQNIFSELLNDINALAIDKDKANHGVLVMLLLNLLNIFILLCNIVRNYGLLIVFLT
jgi:hypothetical protein